MGLGGLRDLAPECGLKSVPYTDAFNDAKTWTKNYILQPLEAAGLSEPYQARGSCWPAKCLVQIFIWIFCGFFW